MYTPKSVYLKCFHVVVLSPWPIYTHPNQIPGYTAARSPDNLVNVGAIAFSLDTKTHVEPMQVRSVVKNLENGVMILQ